MSEDEKNDEEIKFDIIAKYKDELANEITIDNKKPIEKYYEQIELVLILIIIERI